MVSSHCGRITNARFFNGLSLYTAEGFGNFSTCVASGCGKRLPQPVATTSSWTVFLKYGFLLPAYCANIFTDDLEEVAYLVVSVG